MVENKGGAGGNLAAAEVARAAPDGSTLGVTIPGPLIANPMMSQLTYVRAGRQQPDEFAAVLLDEERRWSKVIDKAGLKKK